MLCPHNSKHVVLASVAQCNCSFAGRAYDVAPKIAYVTGYIPEGSDLRHMIPHTNVTLLGGSEWMRRIIFPIIFLA